MQKLMGLMRRCIDDYNMIQSGDKIAVGVSGGKDSLVFSHPILNKFWRKSNYAETYGPDAPVHRRL